MKSKHILINIEDEYYKDIETYASNERRTITAMTYILLIDALLKKKKEKRGNNNYDAI